MKSLHRFAIITGTATVLALGVNADQPLPRHAVGAPVGWFDNLYLNATGGLEEPPGEDTTPFAQLGANWGIPLTQPDAVALGLQLGTNLKFREDDPEWNVTFGAFGRDFVTFASQQGAAALLLDYRQTAHHR